MQCEENMRHRTKAKLQLLPSAVYLCCYTEFASNMIYHQLCQFSCIHLHFWCGCNNSQGDYLAHENRSIFRKKRGRLNLWDTH